jgi:hypothetical protein
MNKKLLSLLSLALFIFVLAACGSKDEASSDASTENKEENTAVAEDASSAEKEKPTEASNSEKNENTFGFRNEGEFNEEGFGKGQVVGIGYSEEAGIDGNEDNPLKPFDFGGVELKVAAVAVVDVIPDADAKELIFDNADKAKVIIVDMMTENKTDKDVSFYPDQAIITTDTGEQLESEMLLSGEAGGDFYGNVKKEGQAWYILKDPEAEINKITLIVSPPYDMNTIEDIGEEKRIEFDVLSWEEAQKKDK